jgi:hypothetical protein
LCQTRTCCRPASRIAAACAILVFMLNSPRRELYECRTI